MKDIGEILKQYGEERALSRGEVLVNQGAVSDGVYYLKSGRLGVYREEHDEPFLLSEVAPGDMVGEIGAATGWPRSATVRAEEKSVVIHVPAKEFHRALDKTPGLAADVVCSMGEWLTHADVATSRPPTGWRRCAPRKHGWRSSCGCGRSWPT